MTEQELSPLQQDERDALCGCRSATIRVVDALRKYREESNKILAARYSDGAVDGAVMFGFLCTLEDIEGVAE